MSDARRRLLRFSLLLTLTGAAGFAAASPVDAQAEDPHTAHPERPTVATHAGTVAAGWFELESGVEVDHFRGHFPGAGYGLALPLLLKFGLAHRLQLGISLPFTAPVHGSLGPGDVAVSLKWRLRDGTGFPGRIAILPGLKLPTGSSSLGQGTGTTDGSLLLISSYDLGPVAMDLNAGITRRSGDGTDAPRTATVWTASFGGPARGPLGWVAEVYGYPKTTGPAGGAGIVALLAGPTWTIKPWLVLDAGGIVALAGAQPAALYLGLTWNGGRFSR